MGRWQRLKEWEDGRDWSTWDTRADAVPRLKEVGRQRNAEERFDRYVEEG